jgi:hypothetical protein
MGNAHRSSQRRHGTAAAALAVLLVATIAVVMAYVVDPDTVHGFFVRLLRTARPS